MCYNKVSCCVYIADLRTKGGGNMRCLYCNCTESRVIDSRSADDDRTIRRRRECVNCGRRFTTYETIEMTPILVVKSDGNRQAFDSGKIKRGIIKAAEKRPFFPNPPLKHLFIAFNKKYRHKDGIISFFIANFDRTSEKRLFFECFLINQQTKRKYHE